MSPDDWHIFFIGAGMFYTANESARIVIYLVSPLGGSNSVVESRLPKPLVAGSIPVSRSKL
jgi:hypothetical protein